MHSIPSSTINCAAVDRVMKFILNSISLPLQGGPFTIDFNKDEVKLGSVPGMQ